MSKGSIAQNMVASPVMIYITLEISSPDTGVATLPIQALAEGSYHETFCLSLGISAGPLSVQFTEQIKPCGAGCSDDQLTHF